jgi:hypothetical protein
MQFAKARAGVALHTSVVQKMPEPGFDGIGGNKFGHRQSPGTIENSVGLKKLYYKVNHPSCRLGSKKDLD